jgi:hypothetical protein
MKIAIRYGTLIALVFLLVSAASASALTATISTTGPATPAKPFVSATVSASTVSAGQALAVSGTAAGNVTPGVQIWVFGDNYGRQAIVPVDANGTFTYTVDTAGFAPGMYYGFIQTPGNNGRFGLMFNSTIGSVVNMETGHAMFQYVDNGTILLNGTKAVLAITNAVNDPAVDDVYTKVSFAVTARTAATTAPATALPAAQQATTRSPLSPLVPLAGIGIAAGVLLFRKARER